jgi:hypothetical protein
MLLRLLTLFLLVFLSPLGHAQYFYENAAGLINLPPRDSSGSYFSLNQEDHFRFDEMLSYLRAQEAVPNNLVQNYGQALRDYQRATQLVRGDVAGTRQQLERSFAELNNHFHSLQAERPEIFEEFSANNSAMFQISRPDPEGTPEFCRLFPQVYNGDASTYYSGPGIDPSQHVYSTCRGEEIFNVSLQEAIGVAQVLDQRRLAPQEQRARDHLMSAVSRSVIENMNSYHHLFGRNSALGPEINQCANQKEQNYPGYAEVIQQAQTDLEQIPPSEQAEIEFELFHSAMALKATALFERQSQLQEELEAVNRQRRRSQNPEIRRQIQEQRSAARDSISSKLAVIDLEIEKMYQQTPMLFNIENQSDLSTFTIVNMQIRPSPYLTTISEAIPSRDEKLRSFQTVIEENLNSESLSQALFQATEEAIEDLDTGVEGFQEATELAIDQHLSQLRESLLKICQEEGEFLHQHTSLYPDLLNRIAQEGSEDQARQNLLETQAGLCSLYRQQPPGSGRGGLNYYGGLAMVVGGTATATLTGWTGIGAAAGVGIITAGGALLTSSQFEEYQNARLRASNADALLATPWGDVRAAIEAREDQRSAGILTVVEGTSTLTGLPLIRLASRLRTVSTARLTPAADQVAANLSLAQADRINSISRYTSVQSPTPRQIQGVIDAHNTGTPLIVQGRTGVSEVERLEILQRFLGSQRSSDELTSIASQGTITRANHMELESALRSAGATEEQIATALHRISYSAHDLEEKRRLLTDAGFSLDDARALIRSGITGGRQAPYRATNYNDYGHSATLIRERLEASQDFSRMITNRSGPRPISVYIDQGEALELSISDATTVGIGRMRQYTREYLDQGNLQAAAAAARIEADIATSLARHMRDNAVGETQRTRYAMEAAISRGASRRLSGQSGAPIDEETIWFLRESGYTNSLTTRSIDNLTDPLRRPEAYGSSANVGENLRKYAETIEILRAHRHVLSTASRQSDYATITAHHTGSLLESPTERQRIIQYIDERLRLLEMAEERLFQRLPTP